MPSAASRVTATATSPQYWSSDPATMLLSCDTLPLTEPPGRRTVQTISTCWRPLAGGVTETSPVTVKSAFSGVTCTSGPNSFRVARISRVRAWLPSPGAPTTSETCTLGMRFSRLFGLARSRVARMLVISARIFGTASSAARFSSAGLPVAQRVAAKEAPSMAPCSLPAGSTMA